MAFAVNQFTNFGKNTTDLFKKKFDYDPYTLKTTQKAQNKLTVESGAVSVGPVVDSKDANKNKAAYLRGYTKFIHDDSKTGYGSTEFEVHTDPAQTSKLTVKLGKLYPDLKTTFAAATKEKDEVFKNSEYILSGEGVYKHKYGVGGLTLKSDLHTHKADANLSVGYALNESSGVSAGGSLSANSVSGSVDDPQFGAEYAQTDLAVAVYSGKEKKDDCWNLTVYHKVNNNLAIGAHGKAVSVGSAEKAERKFEATLGFERKLDALNAVRAKVTVPTGKAALAVEHKLISPQLTIGLASEFDVSTFTAPKSEKFGLTFNFGDN